MLIEQLFDSPSTQFRACYFQWRTLAEFAMRPAQPHSRLLSVIPDILCLRKHPGEALSTFAFVHREPYVWCVASRWLEAQP